ncbi:MULTISPECIES: FeoA family protein [unclassified Desulfovibrio]|uniref:FeoA family protein n=1 Tax=unclassified Desulfovibrio TaxID=2593640 RepID=UPI000F5D967B|nr:MULTISPECIES: FeoA family protein [unclassified Desulfovibrio]RRD69203.1 ferrous iron transport protein A [Desulfovibrio sp. OH1209_COT-279]RRD85682.1 ferrous iron transport protein A [Desulfovibrio sp. OH1186_COT-070]
MTLNDLQTTARCTVARVTAGGMLGQRLCDLGFCPGVRVLFVRRAPLRDPVHVQIGSYHVALRGEEARQIEVESVQSVKA